MLLKETMERIGNRSDADLYLGLDKTGNNDSAEKNRVSLSKQFEDVENGWKRKPSVVATAKLNAQKNIQREPDMSDMVELNSLFTHNDFLPSGIEDFGENLANQISLNETIPFGNFETLPMSIEDRHTMVSNEPVVQKPPPTIVTTPIINHQEKMKLFLKDPSSLNHYEAICMGFYDRLTEECPMLINPEHADQQHQQMNIALKYLYCEGLKTFAPGFFSENIKKNKLLNSLCQKGIDDYVDQINNLLNNIVEPDWSTKSFKPFIDAALDEKIFAAPRPYIEPRTSKECVCFVTGERISMGDTAYVLPLNKKHGHAVEQTNYYVKVNKEGPATLFLDLALSLTTFLNIRCLLIGKILNYPPLQKNQTNQKIEDEMIAFNRFFKDTTEIVDLLVFQYKVIKSAEKCLSWF
jgi:hypothetical protein